MYKTPFALLLIGILYREWKRGSLRFVFRAIFNPVGLKIAGFSLFSLLTDPLLHLEEWGKLSFYLSKLGNILGDADIVLPFLVSIFYLALLSRFDRVEKLVGEAISLIVLAALFGDLLKLLFGRARPYMEVGVYSFFNFPASFFSNDYQSFPSGHVLVASVLFAWLLMRFGGVYRFLFPFAMGTVVYNRLETGNHFLSDALFSAIFGYVIVKGYFKEVGR